MSSSQLLNMRHFTFDHRYRWVDNHFHRYDPPISVGGSTERTTIVSRLQNGRKVSQAILDDQAWGCIRDWHWPLTPQQIKPLCPRADRSNRHFLQVTGSAEWQWNSGPEARSVAWRCPRCGDTYEIRSVKRDHFSGWTEPFILHNNEYAGVLNGYLLGE